MNGEVNHNTFKYFSSLQNIDILIIILFDYILYSQHGAFVCNITYIGCCMVIKIRNQTEFRLFIYVNNTLCPGKYRKNKLGTLSHMAHTSPHIVSTISSPGFKIALLQQIKLPTHYFEFHESFTCLTSPFIFNYWHGETYLKQWYRIYVFTMSRSVTIPPQKVVIYVTLRNLK